MTKKAKPVMLDKDGYLTINPEGRGGGGGGGESVFVVPVVEVNAVDNTATLKYSFDDLKQAWEDRKQIILTSVGSGGPTGYTGHVYHLVNVTFKRNETEEEDMENDEVEGFIFQYISYGSNASNLNRISATTIMVSANSVAYSYANKNFS